MSTENERRNQIKETLKKLRLERAPQLHAVQARTKDATMLRNKIKKALKDRPQTAPSISGAIGETTDRTLRILMEMRTYGLIAEDEQDGDYFKYRLVPVEKKGS
jgi:hypothetical protein